MNLATTNGKGKSKYGEHRYKIIGKYVLDNMCSKEKALEHFKDITCAGFNWHMSEMKKYDVNMYNNVKKVFARNKSKYGLCSSTRKQNQNKRTKINIDAIKEELQSAKQQQAAATSTVALIKSQDPVPTYLRYAIFLTDNDMNIEQAANALNVKMSVLEDVVDNFIKDSFPDWFEKIKDRFQKNKEVSELEVILSICSQRYDYGDYAKYAKYIIENKASFAKTACFFNVNQKFVEDRLRRWNQINTRYYSIIVSIAAGV